MDIHAVRGSEMAIGTLWGAKVHLIYTRARHQALKIYWSLSDGRAQQQPTRNYISQVRSYEVLVCLGARLHLLTESMC